MNFVQFKHLFSALILISLSDFAFACQVSTDGMTSGLNSASAPCAKLLLSQRVGFAQPTGGLSTGLVYNVTSLADSGPGTLRDALQSSSWIVFSVSGTIKLKSPLRIQNASDVTIDGRGRAITVTGYGLYLIDAENVIINNISIKDGSSNAVDAIMVVRSNHVWVHKTSLANFPDGLLDITRAASQKSRVTVSWSHFSNNKKVMIIGLTSSFMPTDKHIYATLHHNYFEGTAQRHPRLSQGYAHVFNNVISWLDYGMTSFDNGRLLVENNFLSAKSKSKAILSDHASQGSGHVRLHDNVVLGSNVIYLSENNPGSVGYPSYGYSLDSTSGNLLNRVMNSAGSNNDASHITSEGSSAGGASASSNASEPEPSETNICQ